MEKLNSLLDFIQAIVLTTLEQLISIFGVFFLFGLILYLLARFTRTVFVRSVGAKADIVWTGWLGTPVHELGHALFCILFGHRINDIKLYDPNPHDGSLGYVNHSYNPRNTFHKIGNFFIGAGPIILGAIVLYAAMYYLLPNKMAIFKIINTKSVSVTGLASLQPQLSHLTDIGYRTLTAVFSQANLKTWTFWIFLYLSICIASHMELSPPDLRGMWSGLVTIVIIFLIANTVSMILGYSIDKYVGLVNSYSGLFVGLFIYSTTISLANFIASFLILSLYTLVTKRRLFSPFS